MMVGRRPVFADIDPDRLTSTRAAVEAAITSRTAAILPVHLYGQPADIAEIAGIAAAARPRARRGLLPGAPGHLRRTSRSAPSAAAAAFSFYPTKNLGALGDGGAITTPTPRLAERLKRLRNGGQTDRYHHVELGVNSRLDEMQAAILRARLPLPAAVDGAAARAGGRLSARPRAARPPSCRPSATPATSITCSRCRSAERDRLREHLTAAGIETLIHYPVPIPRQPALATERPARCPVADRVSAEIVSLPLHPVLASDEALRVAAAVRAFRPAYPSAQLR